MREWVSLIGTFIPVILILICASGIFESKGLWRFSLGIHLVSWFCFFLLCAGFYSGTFPQSGILIQSDKLAAVWGPDAIYKWDYISALLALSTCSVLITAHFISRNILENSRATLAAIAAYQVCFFGGLGSGSLVLFTIFLAGSLLPRFILVGLDESGQKDGLVREGALLNILSFILLMVCVLVFSRPGAGYQTEWFHLESQDSIVRPGALGFAILIIASLLSSGLFPFHGSMRKVFLLDSLERSILLCLQPIWGFLIMFRFTPLLFPTELKEYGPVLLMVFCAVLLISAIAFWGTNSGRSRVFWMQQVLSAFMAVGFFSLLSKGWHGALTLLFFQSLAIPLFLMVMIFHKRCGGFRTLEEINKNRILALSSAVSVLSLMGAPISIGFYGFLLVIWSLVGAYPLGLIFCVVAVPLYVSAGIRIMFFQMNDVEVDSVGGGAEQSLTELLSIVPIAVFLVFLGLIPKIIMGPMGYAATALMSGLGIR